MDLREIGTNGEPWSAEPTQWCDGPGVATGASSCPSTGTIARIPYQQNVLAGAWYDNSAAASNRYTYYVILSPTGTNPDNDKSPTQGYCAWHDYVGDPGISTSITYGPLAFSNQPYNIDVGSSCGVNFVNPGAAGKLDGYTMTLGDEWQEMMPGQLPAGGWTANSGYENSDEAHGSPRAAPAAPPTSPSAPAPSPSRPVGRTTPTTARSRTRS